MGIVGPQEAEVRDEYNTRSFDDRLAHSSGNDSRVAIIEAETRQIESRLNHLETRKVNLQEADDDTRARVTSFVAQSKVLEQRLDRVQQASQTLPPSLRAEFGLTEETIGPLQERISTLTTSEMRDLARQVAGDDLDDKRDGGDDDDDQDDNNDTEDADFGD